MTAPEPSTAWPPVRPERLAAAVTRLAERVSEPDVRAQLHALAAVIRNLDAEAAGSTRRAELTRSLEHAVGEDDEAGALAALRELAALDRSAVDPVDWSAASGG